MKSFAILIVQSTKSKFKIEIDDGDDASEAEANEVYESVAEANEAYENEIKNEVYENEVSSVAEAGEAEASEAEASEAEASVAASVAVASVAEQNDYCSDCSSSYCDLEEDENENEFGCPGCNYEWRDGYKNGWRDAMKNIANKTQKEVPDTPGCSYCNIVCKTRKCAGKCGGVVRYCSVECQKQDWAYEHKNKCGKF